MRIFAEIFEMNARMSRLVMFFMLLFLGLQLNAQETDDVLMVVGGKLVTVQEFQRAYQKNGQGTKGGMEKFLEDFENFKVKEGYAQKMGLDTLTVIRQQVDYYRKCMEAGLSEMPTDMAVSGLSGLSLYIGHLILPLPQHTPVFGMQYQLKNRMDSIYTVIQGGQDFLTVVNAVSPTTRNAYWVSHNQMLEETEKQISRLAEGEMSQPFLDYDGYHLVKVFKKENQPEITIETQSESIAKVDETKIQDYKSGLVLQELYKKHEATEPEATDQVLESFFRLMQKNYDWDVPHYKGAVYHCKDKKTLKAVAKLLKKHPMEEWKFVAEDPANKSLFENVRMGEVQLFKLSQDGYVDELAFGGPKQKPLEGFPFRGISGKKLKKGPDSYSDVKELVQADYYQTREVLWLEEMKKEIPVNVDMKAFKRISQ